MTNKPSIKLNTEFVNETINAVNQHIDAILLGDSDTEPCNLLTVAAAAVEQVRATLMSNKPIDRKNLALLLTGAAEQLHQTNAHINDIAWKMGETQLA